MRWERMGYGGWKEAIAPRRTAPHRTTEQEKEATADAHARRCAHLLLSGELLRHAHDFVPPRAHD